MTPEIQEVVLTPDVIAGISGVLATILGVLAAGLGVIISRLKKIRKDTEVAKDQVTNAHSQNFRDEVTGIDKKVDILVANLDKLSELQNSQGHQLGEIKAHQIQESRDRQALDARVQDLGRDAKKEHSKLWDAINSE